MSDMTSYRAIRHVVLKYKKSRNDKSIHHPDEKIAQVLRWIRHLERKHGKLSILDLFAGHGNLTKIYSEFGKVLAIDQNSQKFESLDALRADRNDISVLKVDAFRFAHMMVYRRDKYHVIDLDPYGFPNRLFPHIFQLMDDGLMFITIPKPYVNVLNGITRTHLISYYGEHNPDIETICNRIALWGLCHWRQVEIVECMDLKSVWRMVVKVTKVKATEYTGVRNR